LFVNPSGFGGDDAYDTCVSWASFLAAVPGDTPIYQITLYLDAGYQVGTQILDVSDFTVNGDVDVDPSPEAGSALLFATALVVALGARKAHLLLANR
jgi:hypothetical protein